MTDYKDCTHETEATFKRWLDDGESWIGVFQNRDLSHPDIGRTVAFAYDDSKYDQAQLGKATAPDNAVTGLGWRYILRTKARTVAEALEAMNA